MAHPGLAELDQDLGGDSVLQLDDNAPYGGVAGSRGLVLHLHGFDGHETLALLDGLSLASTRTTLPLMGEAGLWQNICVRSLRVKSRLDRIPGEAHRSLGIGPAVRFSGAA